MKFRLTIECRERAQEVVEFDDDEVTLDDMSDRAAAVVQHYQDNGKLPKTWHKERTCRVVEVAEL